jgi:hypothetical protein
MPGLVGRSYISLNKILIHACTLSRQKSREKKSLPHRGGKETLDSRLRVPPFMARGLPRVLCTAFSFLTHTLSHTTDEAHNN